MVQIIQMAGNLKITSFWFQDIIWSSQSLQVPDIMGLSSTAGELLGLTRGQATKRRKVALYGNT